MNQKLVLVTILLLLCAMCMCGCSNVSEPNVSENVENGSISENTQNNIELNDKLNNLVEENNTITENDVAVETQNNNKKVAVVFFSATGTTKQVAEYIKDETNADIFEIVPKQKYSEADLNWNDSNSRTTKEQNDKTSRPEIANKIDVSNYDVIFIGYPIWWADTPRIIQTFMESYELSGKTMIPFCTSGGTGISTSEKTLRGYKGINWILGKRLGTSKDEVVNWIKSLNY